MNRKHSRDEGFLDGAHPFLEAISYQRALRRSFTDRGLVEGLVAVVHQHKNWIGSFPVTVPSWVLVRLVDLVCGSALAEERRRLLAFGMEIEQRRMRRERQKQPRGDRRVLAPTPETGVPDVPASGDAS